MTIVIIPMQLNIESTLRKGREVNFWLATYDSGWC
jgi:hypothetical protein